MSMIDKAALRRQIRAAYPGEAQREAESLALCAHIRSMPEYRAARVIGAYAPMKREADVTPLLTEILQSGRALLLPRVEGLGVMTLRRVTRLDELTPGAYGLLEPSADTPEADPAEAELLIVPIEGIDRSGVRLGKGGGYYDRMLPRVRCLTVGAVMSWQWVGEVPQEEWDRPLDAAADQNGIQRFTRR